MLSMKPKPKQSHVAALGLTAALLGGGCGGPSVGMRAPDPVSEHMAQDERARAELLHAFYEKVRSSILDYSPKKLLPILYSIPYGIKPERINNMFDTYFGHFKIDTFLCIRGGFYGLDDPLYINIEPLISGLKTLKKSGMSTPSATEVRDVFVQAVYSALMDEKYNGLDIEGKNVQEYLHSKLFGKLIEKKILDEVASLIQRYIPEIEDTQQKVASSSRPGR
jgi:hypothetical protein